MTAKIDILLATFNGRTHLPELLGSLLQQTEKDWRLIVRDDGSGDGTVELIGDWIDQHRVDGIILPRNGGNLGTSGNFAALMAVSDAPYFAFCDQDDYWLPEKLEILLVAIRDKERVHGCDHPVLAHSDLSVVDEDMRALNPSFWQMSRVQPGHPNARKKLMVQNFVTGCATMGNAALRTAALPVPEDAIMHDWWLALVAAFFGDVINVDTPTIRYRQHGGNVIGAKTWSPLGILQRFSESPSEAIYRSRRIVRKTADQARAFADRFGDRLEQGVNEMFQEYGRIQSASLLARKTFFLRKRVKPDYWPRAVLHWFFM